MVSLTVQTNKAGVAFSVGIFCEAGRPLNYRSLPIGNLGRCLNGVPGGYGITYKAGLLVSSVDR